MTERPILFSGPMVQALLGGRKTQTRRIVKLPLIDKQGTGCEIAGSETNSMLQQGRYDLSPYGAPGDRLWVRESWAPFDAWIDDVEREDPIVVRYKADDAIIRWERDNVVHIPQDTWGMPKWKPSIHMPRWASRLTLEITDIRVERLQDISEEDAKAEGIEPAPYSDAYGGGVSWKSYCMGGSAFQDPRRSFSTLWTSINGPDSWNQNPWVWVVSFKRI